MDSSLSVLAQITSILQKNQIEYVIVGSLASSVHGMYRATADIDILAKITTEQAHFCCWQ
jgi:predicted nucleotidyltransferase